MVNRIRADIAMVNAGLCESREKAQVLIMAGNVYLNEVKIAKPSDKINEDSVLTIRSKNQSYVGRGALKLEKAVEAFDADINNKVALDIGAATGGFTDVLLQNGAKHVYAIDVGYGQFNWKLRNDPRVSLFERTNARYLTKDMFELNPQIAVMDVSFISIKLILPVISEIMEKDGTFYVLIKPQFEAGRDKVGKHGVVKNPEVHISVINQILEFTLYNNMTITQLDYSPITGPKGNIEFICEIKNHIDSENKINVQTIENIVNLAHLNLKATQ